MYVNMIEIALGKCENDDTQDTVSALLKKQDDRDGEYDTVLVKRKIL